MAGDGRTGGFDVSALSVGHDARTVAFSHSDGPRFFVWILARIAAGAEAWVRQPWASRLSGVLTLPSCGSGSGSDTPGSSAAITQADHAAAAAGPVSGSAWQASITART
ncbi:hypothetical protein Ae707Ps1_6284c [Pseudonocardia sp. Ae707_Ps1]|nr:hypothetical protein Ae707Ps1_6284c [Pseudonocardia sp. Ae707_Ps1]